jgi:hypothetical protein
MANGDIAPPGGPDAVKLRRHARQLLARFHLPDDALPGSLALSHRPLRANIDETVLLVLITEQGENWNQYEEQRNIFCFSYGFAWCWT